MREELVTLPFCPRPWQRPLLDDPAARIVAVVHRRAGKTKGLIWRGFRRVLTCPLQMPRVVHTLPFNVMWDRTGAWDVAVEAARSITGSAVNIDKKRIRFANGGVWQAGGSDRPDSWRGGYADEVIVDEYDDTIQSLVPLVIEPMLADRNGSLVRSGTPKGKGLLAAAFEKANEMRAAGNAAYSTYLLNYRQTNALSPEAIQILRDNMTPEEFAQELECSFVAPNSGSYYGNLINDAQTTGRVTNVPYDNRLPVTTGWDLGIEDMTAIWFAQITRSGEWRIIDHLSDSGADLAHYVKLLKDRPYTYERHLLPHDVEVSELGTGRSRREILQSLGVRNIVTVPSPPGAVADGINAVRSILPRCWFDEAKCAKGLKSLKAYRREFNERLGIWRAQPLHDWSSHDADAFRTLAMGAREPPLVDPKPFNFNHMRR